MRELSDVMNEALEARTRGLDGIASADTVMGTVRARVRRRRTVRHVTQAAVAVPVVAGLVLGGWWIQADHDPSPPVTTPTPSVTSSPTPTAEPTPTATPTESTQPTVGALGDLVVEPGYPPYYELPDGMLDEAGPGWVLATVVPRSEGTPIQTEERLFLVRPDGTRMLLHVLPTGLEDDGERARWTQHQVIEWDPSAGTALLLELSCLETYAGPDVATEGSGGCGPSVASQMDLRTGELEPVFEAPEAATDLVGPIAEDRWLWLPYPEGMNPFIHVSGPDGDRAIETAGATSGFASVSPDGRLVVTGYPNGNVDLSLAVTDLDTGRGVGVIPVSGPHGACRTLGWWDDDRVLADCRQVRADGTPGQIATLVTFDMAQVAAGDGEGDVLRTLGAGDAVPLVGSDRVGDGRLLVTGFERSPDRDDYCDQAPYLLTAEGLAELPIQDPRTEFSGGHFRATVVGSTAYVSVGGFGCGPGQMRSDVLLAHDLATGSTVELVAPPVGNEDGRYTHGLMSYAVAR